MPLVALTATKVSPIPSSNCLASTLLVLLLHRKRFNRVCATKRFSERECTMTLENVLYTANAHTTRARENATARTDDGRLDVRLSPAAVSSILIFTASWK